MELRVKVLPHATGLALPAYATDGAAGLDLVAALPADEPLELQSLQRAAVPTGIMVAITEGFEGQVRARSGRALREGLAVLNAPGTIDSDYRGELFVLVVNLGLDAVVLRRGERIAQLVIAPVARAALRVVDSLDDTDRGGGGFGSTGA